MPGTVEGGLKAAAANKAKDPDFYRRIGAIGGRNGRSGGFASDRELARVAGAKGGKRSRRGYELVRETPTTLVYRRLDTQKEETVRKHSI
ncbi:KGG domain-containing protein [Rhodococcus sp. HS-D2]|uniref:general stress protein n=1 Tax=Rhodococcus sp. HS-D2 TaxID=1384636 RepID=UPI0009ECCBF7